MVETQADLFGFRPELVPPEGFRYRDDAITPEEETNLIHHFADLPFKEFQFGEFQGKRRVVSFGWRYDYTEHKALEADPIPQFLLDAGLRIQESTGFVLRSMAQALVTEYSPGAAIGWHKDRPHFGEVMGLSLASGCIFRLRRQAGSKWERFNIKAKPRSAYFFEGPARWQWEHSIPAVDELRYSITFRNLRAR